MTRLALLLLAAVLLAGCGGEDEPEAGTPTATEPPPATTTAPPGETCSTSGLRLTLPDQPELPEPVAAKREAIFGAAVACDYEGLEALAPDGLRFSFGAETSAAEYWRGLEEQGEDPMAKLARVLALPSTQDEAGNYAWPSAHGANATDEDWEAVVGLYPREQVRQMREGGTGYLGYRAGITPAGDWIYFVAGD
jgi:hypothetical protein